MKKEVSINKTIIYNVLSVILIQGIAFFTSPIFSRMLGTNNYGVYSTFNAWVSILIIVLPLSVNSTIAISTTEFNAEKRTAYQSSTITVGILSTVVFGVIIMGCSRFLTGILQMDVLLMLGVLVTTLFSFIVQYGSTRYIYNFQADRNFVISILNTMLTVGISLILVFVFPEKINYWGRIIGGMVAPAILSLPILINIYKEGRVFIRKEYVVFCLRLSIPVIFHALSNIILNQSDRIMINNMTSSKMAGIYSLAYNFTAILTSIYVALNNSWTPFYFEYLREDNKEELMIRSKNYLTLYTMLTIGFFMVFKEVYSVFADISYWHGMGIIPILAVGLYFMFIYSFAINYEFYLKETKNMAKITLSAAFLNIFLNYILINRFSILGAAYATLISYVYEFLVHYVYVKKISKGKFPFDILFYLKHLLILFGGVVGFYVLEQYSIIRWVIAIAIGCYIVISVYKRRSVF